MQKQIIRKNHIYSTAFVFVIGVLIFSALSNPVYASQTDGTITSGGNNGYAWSDQAGWVNFGVANGNIHITDSGITGYVWSNNYGWINMAPTNGGVTVAANGALSGYAWGSGLGWINFSGVSINSSGKFISQANGTIIGTLTFDCTNCNVSTDYRPSNFRTVTTPTPSPSGGGGGGGGISGLIGTTNGTPATNPNEQEAAPAGGEIVGSQSKDTDPVFRADINDNGGVGVLDFNILMIHWGETGAGSVADINLDGSVDVFDFNILMVDWGKVYNAQLKTYE